MSSSTILIIDDEKDILDLLEYNLQKEGYEVIKTTKGQEGIELAREKDPDLILLDIMMPEMDGFEVCDKIRRDPRLQKKPVIFLTARGDEQSEIKGLNRGGDDYITKPISTKKLLSRIKAVMRRYRKSEEPSNQLHVHDLEIDKDRYVVRRGEEKFQLPRKEFELLYFLASRKGRVLDRQTLLDNIWGNDIYVVDRTIDVHIRKIREKIGSEYIETVKGVGYRFKE